MFLNKNFQKVFKGQAITLIEMLLTKDKRL